MNREKFDIIKNNTGFIAALDQSGGSSPKTLKLYGILEYEYNTEEEAFSLIHEMRKRIITSESFSNKYIIGTILFEKTMNSKIDEEYTADYLWNKKRIVSFLKIDKGLDVLNNGVQLMKPITNLDEMISSAINKNIFGTKMRSVIIEPNVEGIRLVVEQQFDLAKKIFAQGLIPIVEPEVDINAVDKEKCEEILKIEIDKQLNNLAENVIIIFKLTIPTKDNFYQEYTTHKNVLRVLALSGGYSREFAVEKLARNKGMIASFSRALLEDLKVNQSQSEFDLCLLNNVKSIFTSSN